MSLSFRPVAFEPALSAQGAALAAIRLRDRHASFSYPAGQNGAAIANLTSGGSVTVLASGEIVGDLDAELAREPAPAAEIVAAPGEYADCFTQWAGEQTRSMAARAFREYFARDEAALAEARASVDALLSREG